MIRLFVFLAILVSALPVSGQQTRTLEYYFRAARENSPLINDIRNREKISRYQLERLRAAYMRSRLELGGDLLFVPVVSFDGGRAAFRWNDRDGTDYAGYDLGESSGHLHAGVTWTQPLLGRGRYKAEEAQAGYSRRSWTMTSVWRSISWTCSWTAGCRWGIFPGSTDISG